MVKFASFESAVAQIYKTLGKPKETYGTLAQTGVSFLGGYIAGIGCAVVSHPADVMVSKLNADRKAGEGAGQAITRIYGNIGFSGLWNGLPVRIVMIGTLTAFQWLIYDSFKVYLGVSRLSSPSRAEFILTRFSAANHRRTLEVLWTFSKRDGVGGTAGTFCSSEMVKKSGGASGYDEFYDSVYITQSIRSIHSILPLLPRPHVVPSRQHERQPVRHQVRHLPLNHSHELPVHDPIPSRSKVQPIMQKSNEHLTLRRLLRPNQRHVKRPIPPRLPHESSPKIQDQHSQLTS